LDHTSLLDFLQVSDHTGEVKPISQLGKPNLRISKFRPSSDGSSRPMLLIENVVSKNICRLINPFGSAKGMALASGGKHINSIRDKLGL
jgi:UbiD family decarboxylase